MAECIARECQFADKKCKIHKFTNAFAAINATLEVLPDIIFLDVLLDGPDGFTFLNEMMSYPDTAGIPTVLISSLYIKNIDLSSYNIIQVLDKTTFTPDDIIKCMEKVNV